MTRKSHDRLVLFVRSFKIFESLVPLRLGSEQLQNDIGYWVTSRPFTMRCSGRSWQKDGSLLSAEHDPAFFLANCFLPDSARHFPLPAQSSLSFFQRTIASILPCISLFAGNTRLRHLIFRPHRGSSHPSGITATVYTSS